MTQTGDAEELAEFRAAKAADDGQRVTLADLQAEVESES